MRSQIILWGGMVFLLFSCEKDKTQIIPNEFIPFVNSFFEEARKRNAGIHLEDFDLIMKLVDIENAYYAGTCNNRKNEIEIDEIYWLQSDFENREWLIFHELGHCILGRSHRNERSDNWECLSFMKGGKEDNFDCSINFYSVNWRNYYLDELFNQNQEFPLWYFENQNYNVDESNRSYQIDTTLYSRYFIDSMKFSFDNDFVIEASFYDWTEKTIAVGIRWDNIFFYYCKNCTHDRLKIYNQDKEVFINNNFEGSDAKMTIIKRNNVTIQQS